MSQKEGKAMSLVNGRRDDAAVAVTYTVEMMQW